MEKLALKFLSDNMAIQIDVLSMLVEGRIVCDLPGRFTITIEDGLIYGLNLQIVEEVSKPLKLVGGNSQGLIFSF